MGGSPGVIAAREAVEPTLQWQLARQEGKSGIVSPGIGLGCPAGGQRGVFLSPSVPSVLAVSGTGRLAAFLGRCAASPSRI